MSLTNSSFFCERTAEDRFFLLLLHYITKGEFLQIPSLLNFNQCKAFI